jgi:hypothetical protein
MPRHPAAILCAFAPQVCMALPPSEEIIALPDHPNVVNVCNPPYNAKGDGVSF